VRQTTIQNYHPLCEFVLFRSFFGLLWKILGILVSWLSVSVSVSVGVPIDFRHPSVLSDIICAQDLLWDSLLLLAFSDCDSFIRFMSW